MRLPAAVIHNIDNGAHIPFCVPAVKQRIHHPSGLIVPLVIDPANALHKGKQFGAALYALLFAVHKAVFNTVFNIAACC